MDPLTIAILAGTQIAAGVGKGISNYQQAKGIMSDEEQKLLKELQRKEEMGALGFTNKELNTLSQQYRNPQQAIASAQADELKAALGAQDAQATDAFRMAMMEQDRRQQEAAQTASAINALNLAEQRRQETQLLGLANKENAMEQAKKAAIIEAVTGGIVGAGQAYGEAAMFSEEMAQSTANFDKQLELMEKQMELQRSVNPYLTGGALGTSGIQ